MNSTTTDAAASTTKTYAPRTIASLIGVAMALLMASLENTIVGTAMPTVIANLGGIEIYGWVFAAYILASTVMTPIWGKTADLIGRRPAMFGGLTLFMIGSALSGAAHSMPQLIGFRVIQGLGAAALFPVGVTIIGDLLTLEQRAKTMPLFSGMWGLASLIGPLIGGILTEQLSWRWCFYIILPAGLLSLALIWWGYSEKYERREKIIFDYAGTFTLAVALVLLLLVIERGAELSWLPIFGLLAASAAFTFAFIRVEQRHAEPLLPLKLFRIPLVTIPIVHGFFVMMALIGAMSFLPLFVQAVIGTSAAEAGRVLTPLILPWVTASIIGGRLILKFGYRPLAFIGMASMLIGSVLLTMVSVETTRLQLSINVAFLGIGGGLTVATLMLAAQHAVPRAEMGVTTAAVQFFRSIGAAFGTGTMGALMNWSLHKSLAGATGELARFANHSELTSIVRPETRASLSPAAASFLQHALARSLRTAFFFVLATIIISSVISLLIPGGDAHQLAHSEHQPAELDEDATAVVAEI